MNNAVPTLFYERLVKRGDLLFSIGVLSLVFILVLPLPPVFIDILLSLSIALAVLIILTISYIKEPTEFFIFPTVLLFVTLFRLGLNVATTRAILGGGDAGHLISAFGQFVLQGNLVVGLVVFIILTIINFVVVTKGAGRVAEVSARFTLDAMPGKQMSIDADLNSGLITENEARARRKSIERDASFYGAMDGASKFVRGDAVAGILITGVNLVGGFVVGMLQMGLSASDSAQKFVLLSVGDGLVTQIPALLISVGAGILVTRSNSTLGLGEDIARQLLGSSRTILITGILMWILMVIPGFPTFVLFVLGAIFISLSRLLPAPPTGPAPTEAAGLAKDRAAAGTFKKPESKEPVIKRGEILSLELGLGLLSMINNDNQNLLDRLAALRRTLSADLGMVIPSITVKDNANSPTHSYRLLQRGHEIAAGEIFPGQLLAINTNSTPRPLRGRPTKEPAFGLPAVWISETDRSEAERNSYTVVDPFSVLLTHVGETLKVHSADLLQRQDVQKLLDSLKEGNAALLQEMTTLQLGLGLVHRVLQNLLREGISIRELSLILEKMCDQIAFTKNPDELSEACRRILSFEIERLLEVRENNIHVITLNPELELQLSRAVRQTAQEITLAPDPQLARHTYDELTRGIQVVTREGWHPVIVCGAPLRLAFRKFFADSFPQLRVLAYQELPSKIQLQPLYMLKLISQPLAS